MPKYGVRDGKLRILKISTGLVSGLVLSCTLDPVADILEFKRI